MSPRVRMIVGLSIGLLVIFGWHFATVFGVIGNAPQTRSEFFVRLGIIFVGFLVVSTIVAILQDKRNSKLNMPDEREEEILLRTEQIGLYVVYAGILLVIWFSFAPMKPMQIANALLAIVCVSEISKLVYGLLVLKRKI